MAEAKAIGQPQYELRLTSAEVQALLAVCEFVSGDPSKTPRGHMDAIRRALNQAGAYHTLVGSVSGTIRFES